MSGYVDPAQEIMAQFRELPLERPVAMINLLRFRDRAAYPDGHAEADAGHTGAQAYGLYGRAAAAPFARAGGRQVWLGRPELTVIGPTDEAWDLAFIAEYPSGQAFIDMLRDPDYREAVIHRQAAVEDSRLIRCTPLSAGDAFGESR